jgi:hypothetical protein
VPGLGIPPQQPPYLMPSQLILRKHFVNDPLSNGFTRKKLKKCLTPELRKSLTKKFESLRTRKTNDPKEN